MKLKLFFPILAALVLLGSCELALGNQTEGSITLYLGGPASRAFSDAPFGGLPVFSSVTVTVSGAGMATASRTVAGNASSLTLQVPAGPARRVEVYAVPDWTATADLVFDPLPTLAKAYGGTAVVDVAGGKTVNLSMDMDVVETKIVLPDSGTWTVYFADGINDTNPTEYVAINSSQKHHAFDRFGRIFLMNNSFVSAPEIVLMHNPSQTMGTTFVLYDYPFAYSAADNALYFAVSSTLYFLDLSSDPPVETDLGLPLSINSMMAVAVDKDGYVYLAGDTGEGDFSVVKLAVDTDSGLDVRLLKTVTFASLDLDTGVFGNLLVTDMTVKDEKLYIAAAEHTGGVEHHGKIVEARLSDLAKQREIGWSPTLPSSPNSQFYGPSRFLAIAPRKLIVADEGNDGSEINRIVEIDLDDWSFSGIRDPAGVDLFNDYFIAH